MRLLVLPVVVLLGYCAGVYSQSYQPQTPVPCNTTITETCRLSCEHGLSRDATGCHICQCEIEICKDVQCSIGKVCREFKLTSSGHKLTRCVDPRLPDRCHAPMDTGPCRAFISRLSYNSESDVCESFIYGGCKGNENNFLTLEDCQTECVPKDLPVGCDEKKEAMCQLNCEHGFKMDASNCQVCECADPDPFQPFGADCPEPLTTCLMDCENGFKKDLRGCDICECNASPKLARCSSSQACDLVCPGGFKKDLSGCELCTCADDSKCPDVMCARYCEYGFKKDAASGCDICDCNDKPKCEEVKCDVQCQNGFQKDANDCEICKCKDSCPEVICARFCEHGLQKDANGCNICFCNEQPQCDELKCSLTCKQGFKKDENGCEICECDDSCPEVMCARYCERGFKKNENGCDICHCQEKSQCNEVICAMFCENGFQKGEDGCNICKCREPCQEVMCARFCEHGFKKNENGCDICDCNEEPKCNEVMCAMYCVTGFQKDENGCNICKCNPPTHECNKHMCRMMCQYGFVRDSFGCETCRCAHDPCTLNLCSPSQVCETKHPQNCSHCPVTAHCIDISSVKKIRIQLNFAHGLLDVIDIDVLTSHLLTRISHLIGVDEEYIRGLLIEHPGKQTTSVTFYVVSYGYWDLVAAYKKFEMDIKTHMLGTSFKFEDVIFVPEHRTLAVQYYEDPEVHEVNDDDDDEHETSSVSMGVIIGCTIAGIIALLLIILALVFIAKSRKYDHDRPNVAYIRAPEPKMEKIITEKQPIV